MDHRKASGGQVQELTGAFRIRQARAGEASALSAVAQRSKAHWGYDAEFMADCADELTWGESDIASGTFWVAEAGTGTHLGFCDLRLVHDMIEVAALYVDPDAMGAGVGRALWRKAEELADEHKARAIGLDADPHAVGFYQQSSAKHRPVRLRGGSCQG